MFSQEIGDFMRTWVLFFAFLWGFRDSWVETVGDFLGGLGETWADLGGPGPTWTGFS